MAAEEQLARRCAETIDAAFATYNQQFRVITQRARQRFEERDWEGSHRDAVQRIELYDRRVRRTVRALEALLGEARTDRAVWSAAKAYFAHLIDGYHDAAFTRTFFSSVSRRIFHTIGVDPDVEFLLDEKQQLERPPEMASGRRFANRGSTRRLVAELLAQYPFERAWQDLDASIDFIVTEVDTACSALAGPHSIQALEFIKAGFFRDNRAYLVGRVDGTDYKLPLVIALRNAPEGLIVDAVITSENEVSILFGFARSYVHADLERVGNAAAFLSALLPRKPISEIYTTLGRAKQGKTERFHDLSRYLKSTDDRFVNAAYDRGMVMIVFQLADYPVVFKVIRDNFAYPKTTVRADVIEKYRLVFKHDRAGRLVDAQEFRDLKFHRKRFTQEVLDELLNEAADTCTLQGDDVVISHLYMERKLTPLNRYLHEAPEDDASRAVLDYGQALRDLAASNIFPGDLLLKNFGVTRHGRVIFYDYDELCLVTECRFRE
ncbi:MAG: bifunctional isocitrate dehydrogenase kinase/phosphatase, partial [Pseudomonadota bacterium]